METVCDDTKSFYPLALNIKAANPWHEKVYFEKTRSSFHLPFSLCRSITAVDQHDEQQRRPFVLKSLISFTIDNWLKPYI